MSGRKVFAEKSAIGFVPLLVLLIATGLLISCAAGTMVASEVSGEPEPAQAGTAMKEDQAAGNKTVRDQGKEADVTNYYKRPENKYTKAGVGMAIFATENFVGSSRCAVCHELLTDSKGNDMSNAGHWRSTMMANAAAAITR